jgi:O-succinylbenzoic acid--CoA ligase
MDKTRKLTLVSAEWEIPQVREALVAALDGSGPALAFGQTDRTEVPVDCAVVIPTSGSTGEPKEVALTASALLASAQSSHSFLQARDGEIWSLLLPITHIAGVNVLVRAIVLGTSVADLSDRADYSAIVPTQLHRALHGETQLLHHLQKTKAVLVGGASASESLLKMAREAGINPVTTYGMSEMSGGCIYNNQLLQGVEVRFNEVGAIELAGPMQAMGYLNRPDLWSSVTDGKWFITGDAGEIVDGKIAIKGRIDDQINTGGKKIALSVIDNFLHDHFPRQRFSSLSIPDAEWGEKFVLVCDGSMDANLIKDALRAEFGAHAVPKEIKFNTEIPLLGIGKPDRLKLRALFENIR